MHRVREQREKGRMVSEKRCRVRKTVVLGACEMKTGEEGEQGLEQSRAKTVLEHGAQGLQGYRELPR